MEVLLTDSGVPDRSLSDESSLTAVVSRSVRYPKLFDRFSWTYR